METLAICVRWLEQIVSKDKDQCLGWASSSHCGSFSFFFRGVNKVVLRALLDLGSSILFDRYLTENYQSQLIKWHFANSLTGYVSRELILRL